MDVKTLSGVAELYREGPHTRSSRRGAPVTESIRGLRCEGARARPRAQQAGGTAHHIPGRSTRAGTATPRRPRARGAASLGPRGRPGGGLLPGLQRCSEALHLVLAREVLAEARARTEWRQMGARRSEHEALGIFVHDLHRRWGSVFWRSWALVIRGRLPAISRPNAEILHHGPPPAYARWRGGAVRGRRCTPAFCAGRARRRPGGKTCL